MKRRGRGGVRQGMGQALAIALLVSALLAGPLAARSGGAGPGAANTAAAAAAESAATEIVMELDALHHTSTPLDRSTGFVSGRVFAGRGEAPRFDVVFAIDVSGSTAEPAGADIDGDGRVAGRSGLSGFFLGADAGGDSVLAAEVAAVRVLLDTLDPRTTRAGIVAFSGSPNRGDHHAWLEAPLSSDYTELRRPLEDIEAAGASGGTNMEAGLRTAARELFGASPFTGAGAGGAGEHRGAPHRHVVLLSDGEPTLPDPPGVARDRAVRAARVLGRRAVHVHAFAIGREAAAKPGAASAIARASGGSFRAVPDPGELTRLLSEVQFASIESLRVRNLSTEQDASSLIHKADGGFAALVPVVPGPNRLEIRARASDGTEKRVEITRVVSSGSLSARAEADRARLLAEQARAARDLRPRERGVDLRVEPDRDGNSDSNDAPRAP